MSKVKTPTLIKTPLRYPGGKSRMVKYLKDHLPEENTWDEYREPFIGGGSMFIYMKQTYPTKQFWINDKYHALYCFWKTLQSSSKELSENILAKKKLYPEREVGRVLFLSSQEVLKTSKDEFEIATAFYIVNKCSFSGLTENSSYAPQAYDQNFSDTGILKLQNYGDILKGVKITNLDYSELLTNDDKVLTYLDPPYDIKHNTLYGGNKGNLHKIFNHENFRDTVSKFSGKWFISYNDNPYLRGLFTNYDIKDFDTIYYMKCSGENVVTKKSSAKKAIELVIKNYVI